MRVVNRRRFFLEWLSELLGVKAGIAIGEDRLIAILENGFGLKSEKALILGGPSRWWQGDRDEQIAVRAEEIEFDFLFALHHVGAVNDLRSNTELALDFVRDNAQGFGVDPNDTMALAQATTRLQLELAALVPARDADSDPRAGVPRGHPDIAQLRQEFSRRDILDQNKPDDRDWDGQIPLDDLFDSEAIPVKTPPECYFDQRFIDYLRAQPQHLTSINWRQFEYLTAEYFKRHGYAVTVGPGRKDGGVDISAVRQPDIIGPDLIVIQCRRYGDDNPVEVDAVKAFWATVNDMGATRGLIATTSRLTKGARSYCHARQYRLTPLDGEAVRKWIAQMASG